MDKRNNILIDNMAKYGMGAVYELTMEAHIDELVFLLRVFAPHMNLTDLNNIVDNCSLDSLENAVNAIGNYMVGIEGEYKQKMAGRLFFLCYEIKRFKKALDYMEKSMLPVVDNLPMWDN